MALGNDLRLESERLMGSGLEFEEQILQLSIFTSENGNGRAQKPKCGGRQQGGKPNQTIDLVGRVPICRRKGRGCNQWRGSSLL